MRRIPCSSATTSSLLPSPLVVVFVVLVGVGLVASPVGGWNVPLSSSVGGQSGDGYSADPCATCERLVERFGTAMAATDRSNHGGGNTAWEERKLKNWAFSELRLVEVLERLCAEKDSRCHALLGDYEDYIEAFFFAPTRDERDLRTEFCVQEIKRCCPKGYFGADCEKSCPGRGREEGICNGHGTCRGDGWRRGEGTCKCDSAWKGANCSACNHGHYADMGDCLPCHSSCSECTGEESTACTKCKKGWFLKESKCEACSPSCAKCIGPTSDDCITCAKGYEERYGRCVDINECETAEGHGACSVLERCVNSEGSFRCECLAGMKRDKSGNCVMPRDEF